ncbi:MAG: IgGFc-binding protein [Paludibacteraceae bacterium]|nr:IgGFc-binding protein [Paludibacteraceae bacterium]
MLLPISLCASAFNLTSADPYWIGGSTSFGTTEGNDYWVTYLNNNQVDPQAAQAQGITFELEIALSARQATDVVIEIEGVQVATVPVPANKTVIYSIPKGYFQQVYLLDSEDATKYKGVHVYSTDKAKSFSCFTYNHNGSEGNTSRDASIAIPTQFLDKEYFVQTYPDDGFSTEFGIIATEPNTTVHVYPAVETSAGAAALSDIEYSLGKGQAVLIASAPRSTTTPKIDLSGSRVCADKPIAVYCGNQQTKIPYKEVNSSDFTCEQIMPISQWGTDFYLANIANTTAVYVILTAAYDNTTVQTVVYNAQNGSTSTQSIDLGKGQSSSPLAINMLKRQELAIHSNLPIMCYTYMPSGSTNNICVDENDEECYSLGNPANAMMPGWSQRVTSMNFFTHDLDPQTPTDPSFYYVYLVTTSANTVNANSKISIDGTPIPSSAFHSFHETGSQMVYANIAVTNPSNTHYHLVQSSGEGFVGMVHAETEGQGYFYTLGYSATPYRDTLVVENSEALMSRGSYDLPRLPQGWYQRQIDEWKEGHERLDTAVVCEDGTVNWLIQTPAQAPVTKVDWKLFDVTGKHGVSDGDAPIDTQTETGATVTSETEHRWDYTFVLPDQSNLPADQRTPLYEYELQTVLERSHIICTELEPDRDTLRTTVRVTRIYHDTIYRIICMGDTLKCFYDSLPHQKVSGLGPANELDNVTETGKVGPRSRTMFIGDKTDGEKTENFQWKARPGENIFSRHYLTQYGCDSTYTLFLFVCDTFRHVDTLHLCANERITYLGGTELEKTYKGNEATGSADMTVSSNIVDIVGTKTKSCECQLNPKYPHFNGCDSLFELHLFLHPIKRDTLVDTLCYNRDPAAKYEWTIQKGTQKKYIGKDDPNMSYDAGLRAWVGFFSDTLRTVSCPECNGGQGCDSINVLKLYIPEPFYQVDKDSICAGYYDYETRTVVIDESNKYYWTGHRNGNATGDYLPTTGIYYDSCTTRFGCDSIYELHLRYDQPKVQVDYHSMANNQTYDWHGETYGPFETPEFKDRDTDTTLYFYDAAATVTSKGCDSIWRLELTISDTYLFRSTKTICDIDSIHWRDSVILGAKWKEGTPNPTDIRLTTDTTFIILEKWQTVTAPTRDSIYMLTITQYPTFYQYDILHVCDNDSVKWQGQWYKGADGTRDDTRAIGAVNAPHCDSTYYLHLIVEQTHYNLKYDTVCQHATAKYEWKTGTDLRTDTISQATVGTFVYWDSLETQNPWKCDSVFELRLTVLPSYYIIDKDTISEEEAYTWAIDHKTYGGTKYTGAKDVEVPLGWKTVTINGETKPVGTHKCDSIHELQLLVGAVHRDTTRKFVCATESSFDWVGKDHDGNDSIRRTITNLPASETHKYYYDSLKTVLGHDSIFVFDLYRAPSYSQADNGTVCQNETYTWVGHDTVSINTAHAGDFDFYDYLKTDSFGCDSTWVLHLHVDTVYNELTDTAICQNKPFTWLRHIGYPITDVQTGAKITDISTAHCGTYEYIDSLQTVAGCDSVWTLRLRVDTVYTSAVETTPRYMCDNDTLHFYGEVIYGSQSDVIGGTKITVPAGQRDTTFERSLIYTTIHGCDSVVNHRFTVFKTYKDSLLDSVCQTSPYEWVNHTNRQLWDVRQGKRISSSEIPTDLEGGITYIYIDSLHTQNCPSCTPVTGGCDSIWILKLRVDSIYDRTTEITMSDEEWRQWEDTIYVGCKVKTDTISNTTLPRVVIPAGSIINHRDTTYETIHRCDSIERLLLKVGSTYRDTLPDTTCNNEPYHWYHEGDPREVRPEIIKLTPGIYYDSLKTVQFGFDSIFVLLLENFPTYNKDTDKVVVCQNSPFVWLHHEGRTIWDKKYNRHVSADNVPTSESDTLYYIDTLKTINGCDSIWTLRLYVPPTYNFDEEASLCESDTIRWQNMLLVGDQFDEYGGDITGVIADSSRVFAPGDYHIRIRRGTEGFDCDSIYNLSLHVLPIYRDTIERRACQDAITYYYEHLNNGAGGDIPAAHLSDALTRSDTVKSVVYNCDSIITLHFYVDSVYNFGRRDTVCQAYGQEWTWYEDGIPQATISINRGDTTWVLGTNYPTIHGCDSTYGNIVYVAPIYHFYDSLLLCESDSLEWQGMLFTGSQYTTYGRTYTAADFDSIKPDLAEGQYDFFVRRETYLHHDCDSTYHLHLTVNPVHRATIERRICQTNDGYFYENLNNGVGGLLPSRFLSDSLKRNDTISTVLGCDSIVTLHYYVDSVYDYRQVIKVCRDTVNTMWEWIDDEGHSHGYIDISKAINIDSVEAHETIHGCDSVYGISLHIAPIYRFDSVYHICENERLVWQGRQYTGDSVRNIVATDSIILKPGIHYDTAHYKTWEDCDSTFYVQIYVHPTFDTTSYFRTCHNEDYIWYQTDRDGTYEDLVWTKMSFDTVYMNAAQAEAAANDPIVGNLKQAKDTLMRYHERMLKTQYGCDSLSRLRLTIHPTYFFYTDTTICSNEVMHYRGKYFMSKDTTYTDRKTTAEGCDSIYQLHLHVKPAWIQERYYSICDNETLIFPEDGRTVWQPGDRIPGKYDHTDFTYVTVEGCDSIYRYYVTVNKTYYFEKDSTFQSGDSVLIQGNHYVGIDTKYDVDIYALPVDTVFIDSLKTISCTDCMNEVGCDSVYRINAHILPEYYHLDQDTICANKSTAWREHTYENLTPGTYITFDSLKTIEHNTDSVYEFRLVVWSDYYSDTTVTMCADEQFIWHDVRDSVIEHLTPGDHFLYDSLLSIHGCDSVFHLYLTVIDTTMEINYDTICYNDTLYVLDHIYTEPGDYKDTTFNDLGCHHFIYTHLAIIPPTVPTAWVDSMCSQELAFDLYYTYTSHDPIAYSLYYDSLGHSMGFEDLIDVPITEYTNPMIITIPTPFRDGDRTKYPRPDNYGFRLVLDNGFCQRPQEDCFADSTFVMSYPAWLTEQRYGDVIALLNEQYNGGYSWKEYQWYMGDSMLVGQTLPYLYIPTGLIVGEQYHVRLTRDGESEDFQTCPIIVGENPIGDTFAPTMGYLAVTPTCVVTGHPYINILSRKDGAYRITNSSGQFVSEGVFRADVTEVQVPAIQGLYIVQLWSNDTPEEPYRAIKIIVRDKCENCSTSF